MLSSWFPQPCFLYTAYPHLIFTVHIIGAWLHIDCPQNGVSQTMVASKCNHCNPDATLMQPSDILRFYAVFQTADFRFRLQNLLSNATICNPNATLTQP